MVLCKECQDEEEIIKASDLKAETGLVSVVFMLHIFGDSDRRIMNEPYCSVIVVASRV